MIRPELVEETNSRVSLIKRNLQTNQSRLKSFANHRRSNLEFEVGDHMFLKVSLLESIMRFGKKGKLVNASLDLLKFLARVGTSIYKLTLSPELANVIIYS